MRSGIICLLYGDLAHASISYYLIEHKPSVTAVISLLASLRVPAPTVPKLYTSCNSAAELAQALQRPANGHSEAALDYDGLLQAERGGLSPLAAYLAADGSDALAAVGRKAKVGGWSDLLTPYTGSMNRPVTAQSTETDRRAARGRCVLRLDFVTPLACASAYHNLAARAAAEQRDSDKSAKEGSQPSTTVTFEVQPYRRRLIAARVTGFTVGPVNPGAHNACSSRTELHGNWELLRGFLRQAAPHCHPSRRPDTLPNGTGAVDFVLEETHRHELQALNGVADPAYGITRPLRLTVSVLRMSPHTACSSCGEAGHAARDCKTPPPAGQRTCKACHTVGHTANDCPVAPQDRTCKLCGRAGHSTLGCSQYRPRWTDVAKARDRPTTERNTFADAHIAGLQGRTWVKPHTATASQRPAIQPTQPRRQSDFPPLPGQQAWTAGQPPATTAPQQYEDRLSTIEQQLQQMTTQMAHQMAMAREEAASLRAVMSELAATVNKLLAGPTPHWQYAAGPPPTPYYGADAVALYAPPAGSPAIAVAAPVQQPPPSMQPAAAPFPVTHLPHPMEYQAVVMPNVHIVNSPAAVTNTAPFHYQVHMSPPPAAQQPTDPPSGAGQQQQQQQHRPHQPPAYSGHPPASTSTTNDQ